MQKPILFSYRNRSFRAGIIPLIVSFLFLVGCDRNESESLTILAVGQSNMEGLFGPVETSSVPGVQVWDHVDDSWKPAVLGIKPFKQARNMAGPGNNIAFVFAREAMLRCNLESVNLVFLASGGKRIEYFLPEDTLTDKKWINPQSSNEFGSSLADEIFSDGGDTKLALQSIGRKNFDIVLVHQGEANVTIKAGPPIDSAELYASKIQAFISELQKRGLVLNESPVILGTINPGYQHAQNQWDGAQLLVSDSVRIVKWENVESIGELENTGDKHATGRGLERLGLDYFDAYQQIKNGC